MKVIIPLAGKGTRLRPHTHLVPKPMLKIAGKPVMAYILEDLERLGGVDQVIYVTGHLKEKVEEYARTQFKLPAANGSGCRSPARCCAPLVCSYLTRRIRSSIRSPSRRSRRRSATCPAAKNKWSS